MTGGTGGIGLVAANEFLQTGADLIVGARDPSAVPMDLAHKATVATLDLERLTSVRSFAASVVEWLGTAEIDALVLNAGTQVSDITRRTADGFETTFAVNHLAHYFLLRLLMPRLASGATVVITTSNLHDPKTNSVAPPEHADALRLAVGKIRVDSSKRDRMEALRAYAASKLCNLLTARALSESPLALEKRLQVIAFNPGFTPGTGLMRGQPYVVRLVSRVVMSVTHMFRRMNTLQGGGSLLANLTLGRLTPPAHHLYASQVEGQLTWPLPSDLACDDAVMMQLWRDSEALVNQVVPGCIATRRHSQLT